MKMLILLVGAVYMAAAQVQSLESLRNQYINNDNTFAPEFSKHFSDKFSCFYDSAGVYEDFHIAFYGVTSDCQTPDDSSASQCANHYCCGYMANGLKQCDVFREWSIVSGTHFSLCENNYENAISETSLSDSSRPKLRRDLCCDNNQFTDCTLCKSFMVWDFTVSDSHGGDETLQWEYENGGKVYMENDWRTQFNSNENQQPQWDYNGQSGSYPPYGYFNQIYPGGYARAKLREFNDPPICVYAPNTAGRIIEVKVEPDETGNQVCVDDLHEDSLERNNPGVTQACDDTRLRTCFPDASTDETIDGFAFLISCSESCADSDVDLWFRVRASINKWTEQGQASLGTDHTELNTEMWCMWGVQNMQSDDGTFDTPVDATDFANVDGDFSRWDIWPSDLREEVEPRVQPIESNSAVVSLVFAFFMLAVAF